MLDIKFIRENLDLVKLGATKKRIQVDLDALIVLDDTRKQLLLSVETKKAKQNVVSQTVATASDEVARAQMISEMKILKEELQKEEEELKAVMQKWMELMLQVPNIPDMSVPDGASDAENKEIKT